MLKKNTIWAEDRPSSLLFLFFRTSTVQLLLFLSVPAAAKTAPSVTASATNISFIFHFSLHQQLHLLPVSSITRQPSTTHSSLAQPKKKKRKNRLLCCDPPPLLLVTLRLTVGRGITREEGRFRSTRREPKRRRRGGGWCPRSATAPEAPAKPSSSSGYSNLVQKVFCKFGMIFCLLLCLLCKNV